VTIEKLSNKGFSCFSFYLASYIMLDYFIEGDDKMQDEILSTVKDIGFDTALIFWIAGTFIQS
jgi:hypothetical protein